MSPTDRATDPNTDAPGSPPGAIVFSPVMHLAHDRGTGTNAFRSLGAWG